MAQYNETTKKWESTIDPGLGPSKVQHFEADTQEELFQKMENAQLHATRRIHNLNQWVEPERENAVPEFQPRALSAEETVSIGAELQNPATAAGAVNKLIEAAFGAKPEVVRDALRSGKVNRLVEKYRVIANEWMEETPEYKRTRNNYLAVMKWLDEPPAAISAEPLPPSKRNLTLAFEALRDSGGLPDGVNTESQQPPNAAEQPRTPAAELEAETTEGQRIAGQPEVVTRPRGAQSSGLRNGTGSHDRPAARAPKWTKAAVLAMGSDEYERLLKTDKEFREFVDSM